MDAAPLANPKPAEPGPGQIHAHMQDASTANATDHPPATRPSTTSSSPRRQPSSPGAGRRRGSQHGRRFHKKKPHRKWKPYTELTWEERRQLVEREARRANAADRAALSATQVTPSSKSTVVVPVAPRLTGSNIMDEREERLGIPKRAPADTLVSVEEDQQEQQQQQQLTSTQHGTSKHYNLYDQDDNRCFPAGNDLMDVDTRPGEEISSPIVAAPTPPPTTTSQAPMAGST